MKTSTEKPKDADSEELISNALLALKARSLIADKDMVTAQANLDLQRNGEWRMDYVGWHGQIDIELEKIFQSLS